MPKRLQTRIDDLELQTPPTWAQGAAGWWASLPEDVREFLTMRRAGSVEVMGKTLDLLPPDTRREVIGILQARQRATGKA